MFICVEKKTSCVSSVITTYYVWAPLLFPKREYSSVPLYTEEELKNESLKREWWFIAKELIFCSSQFLSSELDIWTFYLLLATIPQWKMINSYMQR